DYVEINLERHTGSIIVLPEEPVIAWPVSSFEALAPEHFALLIEPAPEVVIFGSGERLRFPHPRLTSALAAQRIGVETMDFKAACRTYNILMAEGRKVAAALLIEQERPCGSAAPRRSSKLRGVSRKTHAAPGQRAVSMCGLDVRPDMRPRRRCDAH